MRVLIILGALAASGCSFDALQRCGDAHWRGFNHQQFCDKQARGIPARVPWGVYD